tara:strand:- start:68 stop:592 length:525 start_codon:yes stop_codon:yes gene_type:complete
MRVKHYANVYECQYPFESGLREEISSILDEIQDVQQRRTNVQATMSDWHWGERCGSKRVADLKQFILQEVTDKNPIHTGADGSRCMFQVKDFWINIYNKNDYAREHTHIPNDISFVYFVKCERYHSPIVFSDSKKRIRPQNGKLVLFPSYLKHYVPIHKFEERRVTLSGNLLVT